MSQSKRFKRDFTSIEQLPNELFIEIFAYLNGVDAVYAFSNLNSRFQALLIKYVTEFDFKSIRKVKFDYVTKHHDVHQWKSLRLSNDDQTSGQIMFFSQLYPPHQHLSQLQALSVVNMTPKYAQEFLSPFTSFDHLVSLEMSAICGETIQSLRLPLLKRVIVTGCKHTNWMTNLHCLDSLEYNIEYNCHSNHDLTLPPTLKQFKLFYNERRNGNTIRQSLHTLSQLTKLALYNREIENSLPNGIPWEELIQLSMPVLKIFQFCFSFDCYNTTSDLLEQAVASFSTPFYLTDKQWFIQCHYDTKNCCKGTLYSLPFAFESMSMNIGSFDTTMSTVVLSDMDEKDYETYENVKTLLFNAKCQIPHRSFLTSNIVRLILQTNVPTSWYFLLGNLRYLEMKETCGMLSTDFNDLLLNTPQLHSLTIPIQLLSKLTDKFTDNTTCDQLSQKIQSLTIRGYSFWNGNRGVVTVRQLNAFVRIFGKTCEHLSLALRSHPNTVRPILRRMHQLRSLHIYYRTWHTTSDISAASWVEKETTTLNGSDFRYSTDDNHFYIWFGNRP